MAEPTYIFNTSTGSDVAASGAGPATAITGSGASLNATTNVDLSADSPDLSGVATDGSAALWVQTSSGRQFSKITAVDNGTKIVTVATAYGVTEGSRTWAIGGKRATWDDADSRTLFIEGTHPEADGIIETETDQTLTSSINPVGSYMTIRGASETLRTIEQTGDVPHFETGTTNNTEAHGLKFEWLKATNSNGSQGATQTFFYIGSQNNDTPTDMIHFRNCEVGDATNPLTYGIRRQSRSWWVEVEDCLFHHCTTDGIYHNSSNGKFVMKRCRFENNGRDGIYLNTVLEPSIVAEDCRFVGNGRHGVFYSQGEFGIFNRCLFKDNTQAGLQSNDGLYNRMSLLDCIFIGNGTYGIFANGLDFEVGSLCSGNVFYDNTTADCDVTLPSGNYEASSDPFTDAANLDFSLADNAEADAIRAETITIFDTNTTVYPFRWLDGASGGGLQRPTDLNGGFIQ